jgi:hypothetical protein
MTFCSPYASLGRAIKGKQGELARVSVFETRRVRKWTNRGAFARNAPTFP